MKLRREEIKTTTTGEKISEISQVVEDRRKCFISWKGKSARSFAIFGK